MMVLRLPIIAGAGSEFALLHDGWRKPAPSSGGVRAVRVAHILTSAVRPWWRGDHERC